MKTKPTTPKNIDKYIAAFPKDVQEILEKSRMTIRKAVPFRRIYATVCSETFYGG
jgi:hypothetical protein